MRFLLVALCIALTTSAWAAKDETKPTSVIVENDGTQAVPVDIDSGGAPDVVVANGPTEPIPVEISGEIPVRSSGALYSAGTFLRDIYSANIFLDTDPIPVGKRAVIEHVSGTLTLPLTETAAVEVILVLVSQSDTSRVDHVLPVLRDEVVTNERRIWYGGPIKLYAEGDAANGTGSGLTVYIQTDGPVNVKQVTAAASGLLEDI